MTSPQENMCVLTTFTTFYVLNSRFQAPASAYYWPRSSRAVRKQLSYALQSRNDYSSSRSKGMKTKETQS